MTAFGIVMFIVFGIVALISFICWIKVLIALFKKEGAGLGILGLLCWIYLFIWGWIKSGELGLKKTMLMWTLTIVGSIVLYFVAIAGAIGLAASDPNFQKAIQDAQKAAQEAQQQATQPVPAPAPPQN